MSVATSELLQLAKTGDEAALSQLIFSYQQRIAGFVAKQIHHQADVLDLCQAIFVKMVLGLPRLKDTGAFEAWLFQIARHECQDYLRKNLPWRGAIVQLDEVNEANAALTVTPSHTSELASALATLDQGERDLLALSTDMPRSNRSLAQMLGISVPALKSRLFRLRARLQALLLKENNP